MTDILMRPLVRLQVAFSDLKDREDGQTTTEYAILVGFLAIAVIAAIIFLKDEIEELFREAGNSVAEAPSGN